MVEPLKIQHDEISVIFTFDVAFGVGIRKGNTGESTRLPNPIEHLIALRDWCNQVLAESEPKRVTFEAMQELVQRPEMQGKTALALQAILREESE